MPLGGYGVNVSCCGIGGRCANTDMPACARTTTRTIRDNERSLRSATRRLERQRPAEERHHVFLESHRDVARVRTRVDLELVSDAVGGERIVQPGGIDFQRVHVA